MFSSIEKLSLYITVIVILLTNFALLVKMWIRTEDFQRWKDSIVEPHLRDNRIHVDPTRDEARWVDLVRRFERLERKVDMIVSIEKHREGDTLE